MLKAGPAASEIRIIWPGLQYLHYVTYLTVTSLENSYVSLK